MRLLALLVGIALWPATGWSQSLGDAARQEQARRQKNKEKGVKAPAFDDASIGNTPKAEASPTAPAAASTAPSPSPGASPSAAPDASPFDAHDAEAEQRAKQEALWRSRMGEARARRDEKKAAYDQLNAVSLGPGDYLVDDEDKVIAHNLEHLRTLIARAKAEWDQAEKRIEELEEQARREGAFPGWLR